MVDVGMGQQDEINLPDIEAEIEGTQVLLIGLATALEHAAIDQKTPFAGLDQRAGTGHFAGTTEKSNSHVFIPHDLA